MTRTTPAAAPEMVELPQGRVAVRELGAGEPLVFVHGLLVDSRLWEGVATRLADRARCLLVDWPMGSHRQPMAADADLSPDGQVEVVVALLDALGLERATLVGNDSGGAVSQMVAGRHPERVERLVLTNCDSFEHFPPFPFSLMPPIARLPGGMTALALPFRIGPIRRAAYGLLAARPIPPELVDDWLAPSARDAAVRRDAGKLTAGADKRFTLEAAERLRGFERPVRLAWGTEDRLFGLEQAERLAAAVPDGRVERVPGARTFAPLDDPERVAELIGRFLAEPGADAG